MIATRHLLIVGRFPDNFVNQVKWAFDGDVIAVPDAQTAVDGLRLLGHSVLFAVLHFQTVSEDLEELVVYLRSTFPEIRLLVVGRPPEIERRRLAVLGIYRFLSADIDLNAMEKVFTRPPSGSAEKSDDWEVVVDRHDWVEISVPSRKEYVSRVQDLLDLLERSKLHQDTRDELLLALDELVTNAMEWGNRYDEGRQVRVSYYCTTDRVLLKVEDEGEGFNTTELSDPTTDLEAYIKKRENEGKRPGGFGIHMIRNLMDEFTYNDRGNVVLLTKFLDADT